MKKETQIIEYEEPIKAKKPNELGVLQPDEQSKYMMQNGFIRESQLLQILQRTPENHVYTRPAKGGGSWEYVTGTYVKKVLNYVFGWNWDFEVVETQEKYEQIQVLGKLTVRGQSGISVIKTQWGRADIKFKKDKSGPVDYGNDLKAATTDALKKCASELGIASDIYGKNEFKEVVIKKDKKIEIKKPIDWSKKLEIYIIEHIKDQEQFEDTLLRLTGDTEFPEPEYCQTVYANLLRKDQ